MLQDRFFILNIIITIVCIQLMMWGIFLNRNLFPPQVPLFYLRPWGEERLAPPENLWLIVTGAGMIFLANLGLAYLLYREEKFLSRILVFSATVFSILCTIFLFRIINLTTP